MKNYLLRIGRCAWNINIHIDRAYLDLIDYNHEVDESTERVYRMSDRGYVEVKDKSESSIVISWFDMAIRNERKFGEILVDMPYGKNDCRIEGELKIVKVFANGHLTVVKGSGDNYMVKVKDELSLR